MDLRLWPVHPKPLPDELLSSWMIRLAQANGFKLHTFCALSFGRERQIWTRDIDHHAPSWLLNGLSARSGIAVERIEQLTLRAFESFVFERLIETGVTRWVMPLSVYHRTRRAYGQQFCPVCLEKDEISYLRRHWRLSLTAVCVRHAVLLQDRCNSCSRPLAPHRVDTSRAWRRRIGHQPMNRCTHCDAALAGQVICASPADVELQKHVTDTAISGYAHVDGVPVYSHLYFDGMRLLMAGLRRIHKAEQTASFDHAPALDRLARLRDAMALIEQWPRMFLERCASIRQPYTVFARGSTDVPWWLWSVLRRQLVQAHAPLTLLEAQAITRATSKATGSTTVAAARAMSGRDVGRLLTAAHLSDAEACEILASLSREIEATSGQRRLLLLRDKAMLLIARRLHLNVSQLLALRAPSTFSLMDDEEASVAEIDCNSSAEALLHWYVRTVYPGMSKICKSGALFTSMAGTPLRGSAVGARLSRAVRITHHGRTDITWRQWAQTSRNIPTARS